MQGRTRAGICNRIGSDAINTAPRKVHLTYLFARMQGTFCVYDNLRESGRSGLRGHTLECPLIDMIFAEADGSQE